MEPDDDLPQYVYVRVANAIADRIASGDLPPGSRLPGERELAAEYGVAWGTARRALKELRERGLVATLPAVGTFVRRPKAADKAEEPEGS